MLRNPRTEHLREERKDIAEKKSDHSSLRLSRWNQAAPSLNSPNSLQGEDRKNAPQSSTKPPVTPGREGNNPAKRQLKNFQEDRDDRRKPPENREEEHRKKRSNL